MRLLVVGGFSSGKRWFFMLKWLLAVLALGVLLTSNAGAYSHVRGPEASTVILPSDASFKVPGRLTAWLFQNADSVPKPKVDEVRSEGILTAGLVSKAFPARSGPAAVWRPPASAAWLLAAFGALLVGVAASAVLRPKA